MKSQVNGRPRMKDRPFFLKAHERRLQIVSEAEYEVPPPTDVIRMAERESWGDSLPVRTEQVRARARRLRFPDAGVSGIEGLFFHVAEPIMTTCIYWPGRFVAADRKVEG